MVKTAIVKRKSRTRLWGTLYVNLTLSLLLPFVPGLTHSQNYPNKSITLIVGYPPGGSNDIAARAVAPGLSEILGVPVVVENKAGAAGVISGSFTARAAPDGYTLLLSSLSPLIVSPQSMKTSPFNTPKDFVAINRIGFIPLGIALGPNLSQIKSMKQLIDLAQTKEITISSAGAGGISHLQIELLRAATNAKFIHVPYKGGGPAITDTLAGHVDGISMDITPLMPLLDDGRLIGVSVSSAARMTAYPNIESIQETIPGFSAVNWVGVVAPAGTSAEIINKVNEAIVKTMAKPEIQKKLETVGVIPSVLPSPKDFQVFINNEYTRWGQILIDAKIEKTD